MDLDSAGWSFWIGDPDVQIPGHGAAGGFVHDQKFGRPFQQHGDGFPGSHDGRIESGRCYAKVEMVISKQGHR